MIKLLVKIWYLSGLKIVACDWVSCGPSNLVIRGFGLHMFPTLIKVRQIQHLIILLNNMIFCQRFPVRTKALIFMFSFCPIYVVISYISIATLVLHKVSWKYL